MKVLYILDSLKSGGVETMVTQLSVSMQKLYPSTQIEVLISDKSRTANELLLKKTGNIKIHHLLFKYRLNPLNFFSYLKIIYAGNYDIIHIHNLRPQLWGAVISFFVPNRCKLVTTEHGEYNKKRSFRILRKLDLFVYERYHCIISVSEATQDSLLKWLRPKHIDKYHIIPNGIDIDKFKNALSAERAQFGFSENDIIIICVNRMAHGKDMITIIETLKKLSDKYKLLAVGDGPKLNEYKNFAAAINVSSRVVFAGERNDIPPLLKMSNVSVASSLFEGFGLSVLEAMASGIVVLGTDIKPFLEVIGNKDFLFPIGDSNVLMEKILKLENITHYNQSKEYLSCRANKFSYQRMIERHYLLYNEI